jgi:hypothetical protein
MFACESQEAMAISVYGGDATCVCVVGHENVVKSLIKKGVRWSMHQLDRRCFSKENQRKGTTTE